MKNISCLVLFILLVGQSSSSNAGGPLFADRRSSVCDIGSCFYVKINPSIIQSVCNTSKLPSTFMFNKKIFSYKSKVPPRSSLYESADGTQGIFTCCNGKSLYGSISMEDSLGESGTSIIEPHNNEDHIVVSLKHSDFHEDEGIPYTPDETATSARDAELLEKGASDSRTKARYSIKFYYTRQFAAVTPDIPCFIDQALAVVNLGYVNSKVPLEAYSLCKEQATIDDQDEVLEKFENMKSSVNELREGADTAALLVNEYKNGTKVLCGIGYHNTVLNAASPTISVTKKSCILGHYSLGHEIGHNIGLMHEDGHYIEAGSSTSGRRTIMIGPKKGYNPRVNYYSNPAVILPETNTPTGEEGVSNSAAILIRNRFALKNIGNGKCDGSLEYEETRPIILDEGSWGEWGPVETCSYPNFVNAMELKIQTPAPRSMRSVRVLDNSALGGIRLTCEDGQKITSTQLTDWNFWEHQWAHWGTWWDCGDWFPVNLIMAARMRRQRDVGADGEGFDITGGNGIRFQCTGNYNEHYPGDGLWGVWDQIRSCEDGSAVYGIQTRVHPYQGVFGQITGDNTALNDVKFFCAKLPPNIIQKNFSMPIVGGK